MRHHTCKHWLRWFRRFIRWYLMNHVVSLQIGVFEMANPVEGQVVTFVVNGLSKAKKIVAVSGVTCVSSDASDSVSVQPDGKNGSVTFGAAGSRVLTAKDDTGHSVDFTVVVDADTAVDSLEIVLG